MANNLLTARAGEYFVAAELLRRGAYAEVLLEHNRDLDITAQDVSRSRSVSIQVITRRAGAWQCSIQEGRLTQPNDNETCFWVFVHLPVPNGTPEYFIAPEWWVRNDIYEAHQDYLARHGGKRAVNQESQHHAIQPGRVTGWKDRWDILRLF